eukprot:m.328300 g.328300  ORF g.328300 m.328300 type:complete len:68 (+) comp16032_c0_seq7:136-339(+)
MNECESQACASVHDDRGQQLQRVCMLCTYIPTVTMEPSWLSIPVPTMLPASPLSSASSSVLKWAISF